MKETHDYTEKTGAKIVNISEVNRATFAKDILCALLTGVSEATVKPEQERSYLAGIKAAPQAAVWLTDELISHLNKKPEVESNDGD